MDSGGADSADDATRNGGSTGPQARGLSHCAGLPVPPIVDGGSR